jgi:hypothetical protein
MKGKLMIALVILALVFGMVLVACDDGELPTIKAGTGETIYDLGYGNSGDKLGVNVDPDGKLSPRTGTQHINWKDDESLEISATDTTYNFSYFQDDDEKGPEMGDWGGFYNPLSVK